MTDVIISDKQLSSSAFSHVINAPIEKVDIADWLFKLSVAEYQRCCPPDHIACGATSTDDGKPMSIHVEMIGRTLMIQHYVAETATPTFCRMVSVSDAFMPNGANAGASDLDPRREAHRRRKLRVHQQRRRSPHGAIHEVHRRAQDQLRERRRRPPKVWPGP